ncbi:hypothetical protein PPTG_21867 [Phytophthora nicotianae INRA-310]|uniref:Uncharacterized protein n=1 Tax=Phytophthora nicotianae (strain INRA-310) TaxID=761204 RepID=W2QSL6_PHYN3|nr:hypothetical protein PPTG_21867 [Phytophthora nicotianae INRA-310]ETN16103.1 hypothetical protein PPTG_21867 [Phytophthora nicotianae INRA-310]
MWRLRRVAIVYTRHALSVRDKLDLFGHTRLAYRGRNKYLPAPVNAFEYTVELYVKERLELQRVAVDEVAAQQQHHAIE